MHCSFFSMISFLVGVLGMVLMTTVILLALGALVWLCLGVFFSHFLTGRIARTQHKRQQRGRRHHVSMRANYCISLKFHCLTRSTELLLLIRYCTVCLSVSSLVSLSWGFRFFLEELRFVERSYKENKIGLNVGNRSCTKIFFEHNNNCNGVINTVHSFTGKNSCGIWFVMRQRGFALREREGSFQALWGGDCACRPHHWMPKWPKPSSHVQTGFIIWNQKIIQKAEAASTRSLSMNVKALFVLPLWVPNQQPTWMTTFSPSCLRGQVSMDCVNDYIISLESATHQQHPKSQENKIPHINNATRY